MRKSLGLVVGIAIIHGHQCQLGRTRHPSPVDGGYKIGMERQVFVQPSQLRQELAGVGEVPIDCVTFSDMAEPTLAANLGELVAVVRERSCNPSQC